MTNYFIALFCLFTFVSSAHSASKDSTYNEYQYLILFKDKRFNYLDNKDANLYLSTESLARRKRLNIAIDSLDYPVSSLYIDNIAKEGVNVRYATKWLNGIVVGVTDKEMANRQKMKFYVEKVVYLGIIERVVLKKEGLSDTDIAPIIEERTKGILKQSINKGYGESYTQNQMINTVKLHEMGLTGKGVNIALFDAGFFKADKLSTFEHLFKNDKIKFTLDIVDDEKDVFDDDDHGLHVFSCMAAYSPNKMIGTSPDANYYLFRTEIGAKEYLIEELNWIRAAEMADSMGIDIINSSLGYTTFDDVSMNHKHSDLDGKTTFISIGAAAATSRGILVVNSAGNDGNDKWKKIGVPADVETILSIGAVDSDLIIAPFSSFGPNAKGKIKPDVCAMGYYTTVASSYGSFYPGNGTSYSSPILCGGIACLYQASKSVSPANMINAVKMSSNRFSHPDSSYGYGVPDLYLALTIAGINPDFDYSSASMAYPISDTLFGKLNVHVYGNGDKTCQVNIYKKKKFLFIFKHNKKLYNTTLDYREDRFVGFQYDLNKVTNRGKIVVIVSSTNEQGKRVLYKKQFQNYPQTIH
jgi:serine protease AprX